MPNHRLFVALEPPDGVRRRMATLAADLRRAAGRAADDVRWVPAENVHLTLQFLGAVPEERVADVVSAVTAAAAAARPLSLEVKGAGGFPNARRPRVLWLGLHGDVEPARAFVADLGRRLAPLGFPPEARAWSAHLTVGRARDPRGAPGLAGALASQAEGDGVPWRVADVVLFESHLSPKGPRYEALARAALGGG
ncbi:RNA 2',3'-cyclic phosphodiesterase [Anaeromyxobacter oryzae]|uniref:RNA 2',3'-cyclic phosphodiesterase n=1 Tax=Anaeromyxobacter oryzae TaxID=2918170 RepID=A0ABM7WX37_9BACT|nr:RNA 2',3'-cyclic phosphodiesterase [Anaeromyxobacter oryzae]BDG04063.1 RNA 2',3'-cyclic phosphodiesterase [Anaeromyxobacter oryzae]